jgi:outer membrane lipoprotein LolB
MIRKLTPLLILLILAGCAQAPVYHGKENRTAWHARHMRLLEIEHWHLHARAGSAGLFGWTGSVNWQQKGALFDVHVSGPLGMGGMHIHGAPEAVIVRAHGKTYTTNHPEAFLEKNLGVSFPVAGLRYWTLGVPVPDVPAQVRVDQHGRVVEMHQEGWKLTYRDYAHVDGYYLPRKLSAERKDVHIKMLVEKWENVG